MKGQFCFPALIIGVPLSAAVSMPASAQQETIEEIVVTATQRERAVQDIPVSVNLLTAQELERAGVTDIQQLNNVAPSFYLTSTSSETAGTTARIRGVGTQGNNPGLESAVGVFIDGVYRNRSGVAYGDLGRLQRIEVLRGPQGTLFGRNTSAGMLNIITQAPPLDESTGYAEFSAGNYGFAKLNAGYSMGGDTTAAGIDINYGERDGFIEDEITGDEHNTRERWGVRGQLVVEPSDTVSMRFIADGARRDESCCAAVYTQTGIRTSVALESINPGRVDTSDPSEPFDRETYSTEGRNYDAEVDEWGVSGQVDWDIGDTLLTSITAYRDWESFNAGDLDYSGADILYRDLEDQVQHFQTFTQELRLNGQIADGNIDWLVGAFYGREELHTELDTKVGADYTEFVGNLLGVSIDTALGNPLGTTTFPVAALGLGSASGDGANDDFDVDSDTWALFTHNTWNINNRVELTLGMRYTQEEKDLDGLVRTTGSSCENTLAASGFAGDGSPIAPTIPGVSVPLAVGLLSLNCLGGTLNSTLDGSYTDSRDEEEVSGTLAASYFLTDDWMTFASYSKGYKAGGFNLDRAGLDVDTVLGATPGTFGINDDASALEFDDETVDAYELGLKGTLADGAVNLNATVFYQDFENFQLNTFNGLTFFVVTLNEVISQGVELDLRANVSDNFSLTGGVVYNEAEYADDLVRSDGGDVTALAGEQLTHAPEWSATAALSYDYEIGGLAAFAHLDTRYMGDHNTGSDLDPEKEQDAFTLWNARLGVGPADQTWTAELWVQNLTDEEYYQVVFDSPVQNTEGVQVAESFNAFLGDPRTWGATFTYRF